MRKDCHPVAEQIVMRLLEKDARRRYRDGHHLLEELKALQRSLPSQAWDREETQAAPVAPPPPPPPRSANVTEWASRAGMFSRMVSRAYPTGTVPEEVVKALKDSWDLASKANGLEGEIASHTRRLEALERRGRALRAEIGRKVEELAQEESRTLREASSHGEEEEETKKEVASAEKRAGEAVQKANELERAGKASRPIFEQAGACLAVVEVKRQLLAARAARRLSRETVAKDLRKQIEALREQLTRYAESLEEELAAGRERVATRTRDGLAYEEAFKQSTNVLLAHLKGKPECRDLLNELISATAGPQPGAGSAGEIGTRAR
jgi:serine/threonine-protein kinase